MAPMPTQPALLLDPEVSSKCDLWPPQKGHLETITHERLNASMKELSASVQPWEAGSFAFIKKLQDAVRNHGSVDMMQSVDHNCAVATKRMPNNWIMTGPKTFRARQPEESEQPWQDIGLLELLNRASFPYCVQLKSMFRDAEFTYVVASLATRGDLFTWSREAPKPGANREELMRPIAVQVCAAVQWLHELGIAHRDLSLENILLTNNPDDPFDCSRVQVIDFGAATLDRSCVRELQGKPSYQAPEMHKRHAYDSLLVDCFALGVLLYAMATQGYPWASTKPGVCPFFQYVVLKGVHSFLKKRTLQRDSGTTVTKVLSPALKNTIEGLLDVEQSTRLTLGETCFAQMGRCSVWEERWLSNESYSFPMCPL